VFGQSSVLGNPFRALGQCVVDMGIPSEFLIYDDSQEFVFRYGWDGRLLNPNGFSCYWSGGWSSLWVFLPLSGQAHYAELFNCEFALVSV